MNVLLKVLIIPLGSFQPFFCLLTEGVVPEYTEYNISNAQSGQDGHEHYSPLLKGVIPREVLFTV